MHADGAGGGRTAGEGKRPDIGTRRRVPDDGIVVEEYEDGFTLEARPLTGGAVDAAGDHRLAMAFAVAATRAAAPTTIPGASSVDVSYPGFFEELARLTGDAR